MKYSSVAPLLGGVLCAFLLMATPGCKSKNVDSEIQSAFSTKAQSDPALAGVNASVMEGTVTLTGSCADAPCKENAEKAVKDIKGVKKVVNNITVTPVVINPDDALRTSVGQAITKYEGVQADVSGGVITLRGTIADRDKLQKLMMDLNALKPQKIDNQLVIKIK